MTLRSQHFLFAFRGRLARAASLSMPLMVGFACTSEVIVAGDGEGDRGSSTDTGHTGQAAQSSTVGVGGATTGTGGSTGNDLECWAPISGYPGGCPSLGQGIYYYGDCTPEGYWIQQWVSGPHIQSDGSCCYEIVSSQQRCPQGEGGIGRPLRIEERAVTARAHVGERGWGARWRADTELDAATRSVLAELFTRDALFEHASVASFARGSLELMALGAPAELIAAAHRAALDEIEHARLCFALASRFRGEPVGAAPLDIPASLPLRNDLVEVAVSTFVEGCIGETLSAALAHEQAAGATDPEVRAALELIAADEARHAELAWRTVAWAIRQGAHVRDAIARILPDANHHAPEVIAPPDAALKGYGRPSFAGMREVQRRALLDVVLPCAQTLVSMRRISLR